LPPDYGWDGLSPSSLFIDLRAYSKKPKPSSSFPKTAFYLQRNKKDVKETRD
jgi:hypothetical protein